LPAVAGVPDRVEPLKLKPVGVFDEENVYGLVPPAALKVSE
jgi:hypothetical protein